MALPLIVPIMLGVAALFSLTSCSDEDQEPSTPPPRPEVKIPTNCGCYDTSQTEALKAYIWGIRNFQESVPFDAQGKPILTKGKPIIGMFLGENNPYDSKTYTDVCGQNFGSPLKYQVNRLLQHHCLTNKRVGSALIYMAFSYDKSWYKVDKQFVEAIRYAYCDGDKNNCPPEKQVTPYIRYMPMDWKDIKVDYYPQADINAGQWDAELKQRCLEFHDIGKHFLAYAPEANGNWFVYGRSDLGNTPEKVAKTQRHFYNLCSSVGATNLLHVYSPNIWEPYACGIGHGPANCPISSVDAYYPYPDIAKGEKDFIQLILPVGYNPGGSNWRSFYQTYYQTVTDLRNKHQNHEFGSGEMGSADDGDKANWLDNSFYQMSQPPLDFVVFYYFNNDKEHKYQIFNLPF